MSPSLLIFYKAAFLDDAEACFDGLVVFFAGALLVIVFSVTFDTGAALLTSLGAVFVIVCLCLLKVRFSLIVMIRKFELL